MADARFYVLFALLVLLVAVLTCFAIWWRQNYVAIGAIIIAISGIFFLWPFIDQIADSTALEHLTQISMVIFAATWVAGGATIISRGKGNEGDPALRLTEDIVFRQLLPASFALTWGVEIAISVMIVYGAGVWEESLDEFGRPLTNLGNFAMHAVPVLLHSAFVYLHADALAEIVIDRSKTMFSRLVDKVAAIVLAFLILAT